MKVLFIGPGQIVTTQCVSSNIDRWTARRSQDNFAVTCAIYDSQLYLAFPYIFCPVRILAMPNCGLLDFDSQHQGSPNTLIYGIMDDKHLTLLPLNKEWLYSCPVRFSCTVHQGELVIYSMFMLTCPVDNMQYRSNLPWINCRAYEPAKSATQTAYNIVANTAWTSFSIHFQQPGGFSHFKGNVC